MNDPPTGNEWFLLGLIYFLYLNMAGIPIEAARCHGNFM